MNSQEYWRKRALYTKQKELNASADYEVAMRSRLQELETEFEKEAQKYVSLYAKANNENLENAAKYLSSIDTSKWDMTLEEFEAKARAGGYEKELDSAYYKSRIARLQKLHDQFADFASKYADKEENRFAFKLAKQYQDTYLTNQYTKYLAVGGLDINFAHFNEQELKDIVYQPWQGSNFSTRVWNNYTKVLPDLLSDSLLRGTLMGYSYSRIEQDIRNRFANFKQSNVHRLVITEMGHAAEKATVKFYEDSKIDKYQYLATLESHTCDQCAHLDEKVFNLKDKVEGLNYPLIHPYCRCTTVPYDESLPDVMSRWERDPVTGKGKLVKDQTYQEWAKNNGIHVMSKSEFKQAHNVKSLSLGVLKALPKPKIKSANKTAPQSLKVENNKDYTSAIEDLGFDTVKSMNGLPKEIYQKMYDTVNETFVNHPELKGFLKQNIGGNRATKIDVAYVRNHVPNINGGTTAETARFKVFNELNLNKAKVKDNKDTARMIKDAVSDHWWSKKHDFTGLINHEMAHAIANRAEYTRRFGYNVDKELTYVQASNYVKARGQHTFEKEVLQNVFEEYGEAYNNENVEKYISRYGLRSPGEAFAEAYSDESNSKFHRVFMKVLDKKLKDIYHDGNS